MIETALSIACTVWLAIFVWETWNHVAIAASIAPLLLLRTERSQNRGVRWFLSLFEWSMRRKSKLSYLLLPLDLLIVIFGATGVRVLATIVTFFESPLESIRAIPVNWRRVTLSTDLTILPEAVPGIAQLSPEELERRNIPEVNLGYLTKWLRSHSAPVYIMVIAFILFGPMYSFALLYRFSLKSTAVVWLPLLWIIPKAWPRRNLITRLALITHSPWGKVITLLSLLTIGLFLAKLFLYAGATGLAEHWDSWPYADDLALFVEPYTLPWWQVCSFANSLVAVSMYFLAGHALVVRNYESEASVDNTIIDYVVRIAATIRAAFSMYTSACLLYLVLIKVGAWNLPPIGDKLFPWG